MAIAVDATSSGQITSANTTTTVAHTCSGSNRVLVVATAYVDASIVSGVKYNNVAMTKAVERNDGDYLNCQLWYLVNPSTGANDIVATHTVTGTMKVFGVSFTGANTSSVVDVTGNETNGSGTDPSLAVTTNNANSYLIDVVTVNGTSTLSVGANQTAIADLNGNSHQAAASYEAGGAAGSYTMSWDIVESRTSSHCILAIKESIGSSSESPSESSSESPSQSPSSSESPSESSSESPSESSSLSPSSSDSPSLSPSSSESPSESSSNSPSESPSLSPSSSESPSESSSESPSLSPSSSNSPSESSSESPSESASPSASPSLEYQTKNDSNWAYQTLHGPL